MADIATERPETTAGPAEPDGRIIEIDLPPDEPAEQDPPREIAAEDLAGEEQWVFLIDPAWQAVGEEDEPPAEAVVGGWFVEADGTSGYFQPNPDYEPSSPDLPSDPVDAVLQLVVRGEADGDELLEATKEIIFGVAVDEEGVAVVAPAPDDVPSVLATTAPRHRERVDAPGWVEVTVEELADALPGEGVDVLLNPGAPASMRIIADVLKEFVAENDGADTAADDGAVAAPAEGGLPTAGAVPVVSEGAPVADAPKETSQAEDAVKEATAAATR
jgi:hypothetical protein